MAEVRAELVDIEETNKEITLNFIGIDDKYIYPVYWRKQKYNGSEYVDDDEKLEQVNGWIEKYLDVNPDNLDGAIGQEHTVYITDAYNSLWKTAARFTQEMNKKKFTATVTDVDVDDFWLSIYYDIDGTEYRSKMNYFNKVKDKMYTDPQLKRKRMEDFEEMFEIPFENAKELVGKKIKIKGAQAGSTVYGKLDGLA